MAQGNKRKRADRSDEHADGADHTEMEGAPVAPMSECPFTVEYRTGTKKAGQTAAKAKKQKQAKQQAKRHRGNSVAGPPPKQELDQTLPEDLNTTVFSIKPKAKWDSLKKYRNFVVGTENFALQEYIFVNHDNIPHGIDIPHMDDTKFWVARVLEIRAVDEAHVYLRVYWLYWPEELPGGRQPYHGAKELVASNHMEIIDAMTVSGRASVKHWMELDDEEGLPDLFWRQKFDFPTGTLMEVREHCKCHAYYNPDLLMFGCPHCKTWLHEACIINDVKTKLLARILDPNSSPLPSTEPLPAPEPVSSTLPADDTIMTDATSGLPDAADNEPEKVIPKTKGSRGVKKTLLSSALEAASPPASASVTLAPVPPSSAGKKGKGKNSPSKKPTMKDIDVWFQISLKPDKTGTTKVMIQDTRPQDGDGKGFWEEDVMCLLCNGIVA